MLFVPLHLPGLVCFWTPVIVVLLSRLLRSKWDIVEWGVKKGRAGPLISVWPLDEEKDG